MSLFENSQIPLDNLPKAEEVNFQLAHPLHLRSSYIATSIFFLFMLIGVLVASVSLFLKDKSLIAYALIGAWLILFALSLFLVKKSYEQAGIALRERDILYKSGYLFQNVVAVPFHRIQHCELSQGPIERYFGLKTIEIFTAGGQGSEVSIAGLESEQAQRLKDFITKNIPQHEPTPA